MPRLPGLIAQPSHAVVRRTLGTSASCQSLPTWRRSTAWEGRAYGATSSRIAIDSAGPQVGTAASSVVIACSCSSRAAKVSSHSTWSPIACESPSTTAPTGRAGAPSVAALRPDASVRTVVTRPRRLRTRASQRGASRTP
jgi:hypothetical protein